MHDTKILQTDPSASQPSDSDDLASFWGCAGDVGPSVIDDDWSPPSCLELLGPPPFPKGGFPFIGFLATVYDHIADEMRGDQPSS